MNSNNFSVGSRVCLVESRPQLNAGELGKVIAVHPNGSCEVMFDNGVQVSISPNLLEAHTMKFPSLTSEASKVTMDAADIRKQRLVTEALDELTITNDLYELNCRIEALKAQRQSVAMVRRKAEVLVGRLMRSKLSDAAIVVELREQNKKYARK